MKKYTAVIQDTRLIHTWATDEPTARRELVAELTKPGRYHIYEAWVKAGATVIVE